MPIVYVLLFMKLLFLFFAAVSATVVVVFYGGGLLLLLLLLAFGDYTCPILLIIFFVGEVSEQQRADFIASSFLQRPHRSGQSLGQWQSPSRNKG